MVDEISRLKELIQEIEDEIKEVGYKISDCRYYRECCDSCEKCGESYIGRLVEEQKEIEEKIQTLENPGGGSWMEQRFGIPQ